MNKKHIPIHGINNPALLGISEIHPQDDVEVIELTEVFGGGLVSVEQDFNIKIETLQEAISLILDGKISGFEIGGEIHGRWSPVGRVRKWGTIEGFCQLKQVDVMGREGSGVYEHIRSAIAQKYLCELVSLATIQPKSKLQKYLIKQGLQPISPEDIRPKFKVI